uniref:Gastrula zinc finger protein XlCGF7.1-like n=1 Tax=Diabrotica virgifera virgifera TaxID=50390 RepID=A0A6P7F1I7_DIAVI
MITEDDIDVIIQTEEKPKKPKRKRGMRDILAKMTPEEYEKYLIQPADSDVPLNCDKCFITFKNNVEKGLHSIKHNEKGFYECHVCEDFVHQTKQAFDIHIRDHEGIKKYKCPICERQFTTIRPAYEHQYSHKDEKPFECDICHRKFPSSHSAKNHKNIAHYEMLNGQKYEKYDCKICNIHYAGHAGLANHNFKFHKDLCRLKPALCDICGKEFITKYTLKKHKASHSEEMPFACDLCPKKFARPAGLKQHQLVHTGEKPYTCEYCGKKFAHNSSYNNHIRLHIGYKPFACVICGKKYTAGGNLKVHMANNHSSYNLKK